MFILLETVLDLERYFKSNCFIQKKPQKRKAFEVFLYFNFDYLDIGVPYKSNSVAS